MVRGALPWLVMAPALVFAQPPHDAEGAQSASAPPSRVSSSSVPPPSSGPSRADDGPRTHLGPVVLRGDFGSLRLALATQLRGTVDHAASGADGVFELRRLRMWVRARLLDDRVAFRLQLDASPRSPELIDLWLQGEARPGLALRVGQMKVPFSHHWDRSFTGTVFVDWPLTTRYFFGRSIGLLAFDPRRDQPWTWDLGIFTGEASRAANGFREPTIYGEPRFNRSSFRSYVAPGTPHPEVAGRLRWHEGPLTVAASAAWDMRPTYTQDQLARFGFDGELRLSRFGFYAGGFLSLFEDGDGNPMLGLGGSHLEAQARLHERIELGLRYVTIVRSDALRKDAKIYAMQHVADVPEDADRYRSVGELHAEHELALALAVYAVGHDLKWQNDVTWRRQSAAVDRDSLQIRTQIQLAF